MFLWITDRMKVLTQEKYITTLNDYSMNVPNDPYIRLLNPNISEESKLSRQSSSWINARVMQITNINNTQLISNKIN